MRRESDKMYSERENDSVGVCFSLTSPQWIKVSKVQQNGRASFINRLNLKPDRGQTAKETFEIKVSPKNIG